MNKRLTNVILPLLLAIFFVPEVMAQRNYADSSTTNTSGGLLCLNCAVNNPDSALGNNNATASSLTVTLGVLNAFAQQDFHFNNAGNIGDSIVVLVETPNTLINVNAFANVYLETYNMGVTNNDRTSVLTNAVLRLLPGTNRYAIHLPASADFDEVAIRLDGSVANLLSELKVVSIYHSSSPAYSAGSCAKGISYTAGNNLLCLGCKVENPNHVIDNIDTNFSTLNVLASALGGYVNQTIIWPSKSQLGDSIIIEISDTGNSLLTAQVLSALSIGTYDGTRFNNDRTSLSNNSLQVQLLSGGPVDRIRVAFQPAAIFDRAEIRLEAGVVSALKSVDIYSVCKNSSGTPQPPVPDDCNAAIAQTNKISSLCIGCSVTNPTGPVNNNSNDFSEVNVPVGLNGYASQTFSFSQIGGAGDTVRIIIENPSQLLSLGVLTNLTTSTSLSGIPNNDEQSVQTSILRLLADSSRFVYTVVPSKPFNSVTLSLKSGLLTALATIRVYDVCLQKDPNNPVFVSPCYGLDTITTVGSGGLCLGCGVTNRENVVDSDPTNYSTLNLTVSLLGAYVYQRAKIKDPVCVGDSVTIVVENPTGLLDVTLLGGTSIRLRKNGSDVQNTSIDASLLRLVNGLIGGGNTRSYTFAATADFDEIELRLNAGLVGALSSLRWYTVCVRPVAAPYPKEGTVVKCLGDTAQLRAWAPEGATIQWYSAETGGTLLDTGALFTTPVLNNDTTYWLQSVRSNDTLCRSNIRVPVEVKVINPPAAAQVSPKFEVCLGGDVLIQPRPLTNTFNFYSDSSTNDLVFRGASLNYGPVFGDTTFFIQNSIGRCGSDTLVRTDIEATGTTPIAKVEVDSIFICNGSSTILRVLNPNPGTIYLWFDALLGGIPLLSDTTLNTGPLTQTTSFFLQAFNLNCGLSLARTRVTVVVLDSAKINILTDSAESCFMDSVMVSATTDNPNAAVTWYHNANDLLPSHIGEDYTYLPSQGADTLFVEASALGCASDGRKEVYVWRHGNPDGKVTVSDTAICSGDSVTLTADSKVPNSTIQWWDAATGGNMLGTDSFTTPSLIASTVYYADFISPLCNAMGREALTVNVVDSLDKPTPTCDSTTENYIRFAWNQVTGANRYEVSINGGAFVTPNLTGGKHQVTGLSKGDSATIRVRAFGNGSCLISGASDEVTCYAITCVAGISLSTDNYSTCFNDSITLSATPQAGGTINWYSDSTDMTPVATGENYRMLPKFGLDTLWVEATLAGCDNSIRRPIYTSRYGNSEGKPIFKDTTICSGTSVTLTAEANVPGAIIEWYDAPNGGNLLDTGLFVTPNLTNSTTYYVSYTAPSCNATGRFPLVVLVLDSLVKPTPRCDSTSNDYIRFEWDMVSGANRYEVSIDGGPFVAPNMLPNKHIVNGLSQGDSVSIVVKAFGNGACLVSGQSRKVTCYALACQPSTATALDFINACEGQPATLEVNNINFNNYEIIFEEGNPTITGNTITFTPGAMSRFYTIKLIDLDKPFCDTVRLRTFVNIQPKPGADFEVVAMNEGIPGVEQNKFQFITLSNGATEYYWAFGDGDSSDTRNPVHEYGTPGEYEVTHWVKNSLGCSDTSETQKVISKKAINDDIFVPNVFSPDNNGVNDLLMVYGDKLQSVELYIFNQYGNQVFHTNVINDGWNGEYNGKPQPTGVYIYQAVVIDSRGDKQELQGTFTLTR